MYNSEYTMEATRSVTNRLERAEPAYLRRSPTITPAQTAAHIERTMGRLTGLCSEKLP
jgi:hypothetical protein